MFLLLFEVTADLNHPDADHIGGAFVGCWIDRATLREAEYVARKHIAQAGWIVGEFDEAYPVDEATYPPGSVGRSQFEQALLDREVFVFHTYPIVDQE